MGSTTLSSPTSRRRCRDESETSDSARLLFLRFRPERLGFLDRIPSGLHEPALRGSRTFEDHEYRGRCEGVEQGCASFVRIPDRTEKWSMETYRTCMNETQVAQASEVRRWYHWHRFALAPSIRIRKADKYNTASFHFHWLVFRVWTMDSPDIGFEVMLDDQTLMIRGRAPFLIFGAFIPVFPESWSMKLWRRPALWRARYDEGGE